MYSADGARFEVPLEYLETMVFAELLRMSEEEFGFASGGDGGSLSASGDHDDNSGGGGGGEQPAWRRSWTHGGGAGR